jgi:hypothetical protein
MNKTLHRKLTEKHLCDHPPVIAHTGDDGQYGFTHEMNILQTVAKDLLQPRPQAIANILKLARTI